MSLPTITTVIPTHNRPELIGRAIGSVLNQTVKVDEIIVVDDSNCEDTKKIVDSFCTNNLHYISNPNTGASSSRNLGAEIAKSNFIAFLDDDDTWLPNKIELQKKQLTISNCDAVFSRIQIKYENTDIFYCTRSKNVTNPLESICLENFIGATISAIINRSLFNKVGGFDTQFPAREEYDLWIRLLSIGAKIEIVERALSISYRSLDKRIRISSSIKHYEQAIDMLNKKHINLVKKTLNTTQQRNRVSKQCEFLAAQGVSLGMRRSPFCYYIKSFLNQPNFKPLLLALFALFSPLFLIKIRSKLIS